MWEYNSNVQHSGVMGMHWGHRSGIQSLQRMSNRHKKITKKLESTTNKLTKTKQKVDKLTTKLTKNGGYKTEIGYALAKNNGRKLGRQLHADKKLTKKINRIKNSLENNDRIMQTSLASIPKDQISIGRQMVADILKNN